MRLEYIICSEFDDECLGDPASLVDAETGNHYCEPCAIGLAKFEGLDPDTYPTGIADRVEDS